MTTLNKIKIREEILNLIRNSNIVDISKRNVTTFTDNFTGVPSQTTITLSNVAVTNIRSLKINSIELNIYEEYDINILGKSATESQVIELVTPLVGGESIEITYDYNTEGTLSGEKIRAEYNQDFITQSQNNLPRVGFQLQDIMNKNRSIDENLQQKTIMFDFYIVAYNSDIDLLYEEYYDLIFNNRKNLYWLKCLRPSGDSAKKPFDNFKNNLAFLKLFGFRAYNEFER